MQDPDPEVVRAAAAGDLEAFERLVRAYQEPLWRFLRHLVVDPARAEDLTQEAFLRAFDRLETFDFRAKFTTWLFQIGRNAAIDVLRARDRRRSYYTLAAPVAAPPEPGPAARNEVWAAVASLPDRLRETVLLVEVLGLSHREAARVLEIAPGTVGSRMFHAREELTDWLAPEPGPADASTEADGGL